MKKYKEWQVCTKRRAEAQVEAQVRSTDGFWPVAEVQESVQSNKVTQEKTPHQLYRHKHQQRVERSPEDLSRCWWFDELQVWEGGAPVIKEATPTTCRAPEHTETLQKHWKNTTHDVQSITLALYSEIKPQCFPNQTDHKTKGWRAWHWWSGCYGSVIYTVMI